MKIFDYIDNEMTNTQMFTIMIAAVAVIWGLEFLYNRSLRRKNENTVGFKSVATSKL